MRWEKILDELKRMFPEYDKQAERMVEDLRYLSSFVGENYEDLSDNEIAAGLAVLLQGANEDDVNYSKIKKRFGVDVDNANESAYLLNALLSVCYPDPRYSRVDRDDIEPVELFPGYSPGHIFWEDFITFVRKKFKNKKIDEEEILEMMTKNKSLLTQYLKNRKFPKWISDEIKRWKKEKRSGIFIVNDIFEGLIEIVGYPVMEDFYYVKDTRLWEQLKIRDYIKMTILPYKAHYFIPTGRAEKLPDLDFYNFFIPPKFKSLDIENETIPVIFSAVSFADFMMRDSASPAVEKAVATVFPTLFFMISESNINFDVKDIKDAKYGGERMFLLFGNFYSEIDELFKDVIKNDELREISIMSSYFIFSMYVKFVSEAGKIFNQDLISVIQKIKKVKYTKQQCDQYLLKMQSKFKDRYKHMAISLLYLIAYSHSNKKRILRKDWEYAYNLIDIDSIRKLDRKIEKILKMLEEGMVLFDTM